MASKLSPESLVFFLKSFVTDDVNLLHSLLDEYPMMSKQINEMTKEELENLYSPVECTNHFYVTDNDFGLVLEDTSRTRALVSECKTDLNKFIFWGANSDPVQLGTAVDIAYAFEKSKDNKAPQKILSFLQNKVEKKEKKIPSFQSFQEKNKEAKKIEDNKETIESKLRLGETLKKRKETQADTALDALQTHVKKQKHH